MLERYDNKQRPNINNHLEFGYLLIAERTHKGDVSINAEVKFLTIKYSWL